MNEPLRPEPTDWVAWGFIGTILALVAALAALAMGSGCASYETWALDRATGQMVLVGKGRSDGLLRDYSVNRRYDPATGNLIEETITTKSTTSDVLRGVNEIGGTLVNAAGKVMP